MTVSRAVSAIVLSAGLLAACTSSGSNGTTGSPGPSGSSGPSAPCTKASAKTVKQVVITAGGFSPSCVKIKAKTQLFFVNGDRSRHTATTRPGAPVQFDANLRNKASAYPSLLKTTGKYVVFDKVTKKEMILFVT
jgi:plastocyanin